MYLTENIHPSWLDFFNSQELRLIEIEQRIGKNYTPDRDKVFRFAEVDLQKVTCTILGKDPYPQANAATGRAFEVANITSWDSPKINRSLQNILKLLHKTYFGLEKSLNIENIRAEISSGKFPILPPNEVFEYWEKEGVLFLNTALTTEIGKIGSHLKVWEPFFIDLLKYIVSRNINIQYFLWGDARKYIGELSELGVPFSKIYTSYHPSSFYSDSGGVVNDGKFLNSSCFKDTFTAINWIAKDYKAVN